MWCGKSLTTCRPPIILGSKRPDFGFGSPDVRSGRPNIRSEGPNCVIGAWFKVWYKPRYGLRPDLRLLGGGRDTEKLSCVVSMVIGPFGAAAQKATMNANPSVEGGESIQPCLFRTSQTSTQCQYS